MANLRPHKIRTQTVDVEFENPPNAFEVNNLLARVCKLKLLPAIEQLFDEKVPEKKIITIEKLQLDIGEIDWEIWEDQFVEKVVNRLKDYLDDLLSGKANREIELELQDQSAPFNAEEGTDIYEGENKHEELLHFLRTGVLPWYSSIKSSSELHHKFSLKINSEPDFKEKVRELVNSDERAFERLVFQLKEDLVLSVLVHGDQKQEEMRELQKCWCHILEILKVPLSKQKMICFDAIRSLAVQSGKTIFSDDYSVKLSNSIIETLNNQDRELLAEIANHPQNFDFTSTEKQILENIKINKQKWAPPGNSTEKAGLQNTADENEPNEKKLRNSRVQQSFDEENPVFIANSGLVLLHPFLSSLFGNIGYTEKNKWKSKATQQRSILLTQFLVTGQDESPEFDLILNKILTGYPLENSFPADIRLSEFEKEEANDMLLAVINHWKALKNTSIPGLQNTFLQRDGKLVKTESGWLLQVEQKAFDILIDKIPWGFSTIKTLWMDEILSVEWT